MKTLAFIPARSGSKSVPDKNVALVCGTPLLHFTIWAAQCSRAFDEILVSTDSLEYLRIAGELGARQDYLRPAALASDDSPTRPAIMHALDWYASRDGISFDAVMVLQPTAPFRTPEHIRQALALLASQPRATCVTGIARLDDHHPARIKRLRDGLWLEDFCVPEPDGGRRQDLKPDAFIRNGTIYLTRMSTLQHGSILGDRVCGFVMPEANSINVDVPLDLLLAEVALGYDGFREELAFFREFVRGRSGAGAR